MAEQRVALGQLALARLAVGDVAQATSARPPGSGTIWRWYQALPSSGRWRASLSSWVQKKKKKRAPGGGRGAERRLHRGDDPAGAAGERPPDQASRGRPISAAALALR
ncbi:MAG: hypothetical protein U1E53_30325 [Dongiaceae bacterium]